jgi:hypothetical protein
VFGTAADAVIQDLRSFRRACLSAVHDPAQPNSGIGQELRHPPRFAATLVAEWPVTAGMGRYRISMSHQVNTHYGLLND